MVRRPITITAVLLVALLGAARANADPPAEEVFTMTCDDGTVVDITLGAPPNQSSNVFVVGDPRMFVVKAFVVVDEFGNVVYEFDRGSKGFEDLLTCTFEAFGFFATANGFFTPR